jgi:hypothetical protein
MNEGIFLFKHRWFIFKKNKNIFSNSLFFSTLTNYFIFNFFKKKNIKKIINFYLNFYYIFVFFFRKKQLYTFNFFLKEVYPLRLQFLQKKKAQLFLSVLTPSFSENFFSPLFLISGSLTASSIGLTRKSRYSSVAQLLSCFFLRRYLILLNAPSFEVYVKNGVGIFSLLWRYITTPTDEIYWDFFSNQWVFDVKIFNNDLNLLLLSDSFDV